MKEHTDTDTKLNTPFYQTPRFLGAMAVALMLGLAGLGVYTWQLGNTLQALQGDAAPSEQHSEERDEALLEKSDRLAALVEEESRAQRSGDPFSDPFFDNFFSSGSPFAANANPWQRMQQMQQRMDSLFASAFSGAGLSSSLGGGQADIAVEDAGDAFQVVIPVQENAEIDLNTALDNNVLSINARMQHRQEQSSNSFLGSSTSISQFSRQIPLPGDVSAIGMSTEHQGDRIVITIPKQSPQQNATQAQSRARV